ncbi:hypothetical protein PHMEG_000373 [Phytophthora megakarya]|uniref:DDE Tnp4 domain-containing protein n=1 Tax=Phytophthora megakarya TaxID=4795 RepID=A0A225X4G1_9STRA|nr:hypothetical protein PHMEG_000373 [Phytophthora megakarya]
MTGLLAGIKGVTKYDSVFNRDQTSIYNDIIQSVRLNSLALRIHSASVRYLLGDDDGFKDEIDEQLELLHEQVNCTRYTFRSNKYRKCKDKWNTFLDANGEFNDEEFIGHFGMSRGTCAALVNLVHEDPVFKPKDRRQFSGGPTLHMLLLLKFLGSFGNENTSPKLAHFIGVGKCSVKNYVTTTWPENEERQLIAARIQEKYAFVNCIDLVDGTLLPLEFKSKRNEEDYFSRKGGYSLNALVFVMMWIG